MCGKITKKKNVSVLWLLRGGEPNAIKMRLEKGRDFWGEVEFSISVALRESTAGIIKGIWGG